MSRVSISKSYAVLLGLEGYMKTKKHLHDNMVMMEHKAEEIFHPEQAQQRLEKEKDKSESARKEREFLAKEEAKRREQRGTWRSKKSKEGESSGEGDGLLKRFKTLGRKMRKSGSTEDTPEKSTG